MARKHRVRGRSVSPTYRPLVTCHVSTGLSGYRNPLMMIGCRAAYPQPSIAGDDDVADRINPGRHGGLHGIAPGCPGMAGEFLQLVSGDSPGTIRSSYDPDYSAGSIWIT